MGRIGRVGRVGRIRRSGKLGRLEKGCTEQRLNGKAVYRKAAEHGSGATQKRRNAEAIKPLQDWVCHDNSAMTLPPSTADLPRAFAKPALLPPQAYSGTVQLGHLGVIKAVGEDAATFLQGQLTQEISTMSLNEARLAAFCNAKGRMQASFVVFKRKNESNGDDVLMVCSQDLLAQTLKRLSMFVMRAKVKLSDASAEFSLYGLCGDAADTVQATILGAACARIHWSKSDIDAANVIQLYPGAGVARSLWCAPSAAAPPQGEPLPLATWQYLEVQSGIAMITLPIFEAFVPQMLNYESVGGVNFKKGCYPGQEVVARSQFRGTLKRRAYLVQTAGTPGAEVFIGQEVFQTSDAEQPCGLVAACAVYPAGGFALVVSMQTAAAAAHDLATAKKEASPLRLGSSGGPALDLQSLPYLLLEDI